MRKIGIPISITDGSGVRGIPLGRNLHRRADCSSWDSVSGYQLCSILKQRQRASQRYAQARRQVSLPKFMFERMRSLPRDEKSRVSTFDS